MRSLTTALLTAALATLSVAGCATTDREPRPPEAEETSGSEARTPEATTQAPAPGPAPVEPAVVRTRRAEEALERAPVPPAGAAHPSVVEVRFDHGAASLTAGARSALDALSERLRSAGADVYLELQGHTDSTGSETASLRLAELRAESVRAYLHREKGLPLDSLGVVPHGAAVPVADNSTPDGRARNRRVTVVLIPPP